MAHCRIIIGSDFFISAVEFSCGAHCAIFELQTNDYYFYIESMPQNCLSTKSLIFHRFEFLKRVKIIFVFFFVFWGVRLMWTTSCRRWIVLNLYFYFWLYFKNSEKFLGIFEKWLLETKIVVFFFLWNYLYEAKAHFSKCHCDRFQIFDYVTLQGFSGNPEFFAMCCTL